MDIAQIYTSPTAGLNLNHIGTSFHGSSLSETDVDEHETAADFLLAPPLVECLKITVFHFDPFPENGKFLLCQRLYFAPA